MGNLGLSDFFNLFFITASLNQDAALARIGVLKWFCISPSVLNAGRPITSYERYQVMPSSSSLVLRVRSITMTE